MEHLERFLRKLALEDQEGLENCFFCFKTFNREHLIAGILVSKKKRRKQKKDLPIFCCKKCAREYNLEEGFIVKD